MAKPTHQVSVQFVSSDLFRANTVFQGWIDLDDVTVLDEAAFQQLVDEKEVVRLKPGIWSADELAQMTRAK